MKHYRSWIIVPMMALACNPAPELAGEASTAYIDPEATTCCPDLSVDDRGRIVMSWVRIEQEGALMVMAVSEDHGRTFGPKHAIGPSRGLQPHGENLPKVIVKPDGTTLAVWGADAGDPRNKYAGVVSYARSQDGGRTWGNAIPLVTDTAGFDQRYFDLALLPDGEVAIIWLDNRRNTPGKGRSVYFATTAPGQGFGPARPIQEGACECCRTKLMVEPNGTIHIAYRAILGDTVRDMVHSASFDGGSTFQAPRRISADNWVLDACPHSGPTMARSGNHLHFAWYSAADDEPAVYATTSPDNGQHFMPRQRWSQDALVPHPQMTALPGGGIATVWEEIMRTDTMINARIVLRYIDPAGGVTMYEASPLDAEASFPVLVPTGEEEVLVAWVSEPPTTLGGAIHHGRASGGRVAYRLMRLE